MVAIQLQFDVDFSPPSAALAAQRPELYRAYNRPVLSHMQRAVKVRILDDNNQLIVSGPQANISLYMSVRQFYEFDTSPTAAEVAIQQSISANNRVPVWTRATVFMSRNASDQSTQFVNGFLV
jgi:hypothetical protein